MKFYLLPKGAGFPERLVGTQLDAKAGLKERGLKGNIEELIHEVPTDKDGLMNYINDLFDQGTPEDPTVTPMDLKSVETLIEEKIIPNLRTPTETGMVPAILEAQIEALGEGGLPALERLDSYQDLQGVGVSFARGVILLCVLASGEHQLARMFRKRKIQT